MKKVALVIFGLLMGSNVFAATQQECLNKAGQAVLVSFLKSQGNGLATSFRSVRLGTFDDQGPRTQPYSVHGNKIIVTVSSSAALDPASNSSEEFKSTEFYSVRILDAASCRLGTPENITQE